MRTFLTSSEQQILNLGTDDIHMGALLLGITCPASGLEAIGLNLCDLKQNIRLLISVLHPDTTRNQILEMSAQILGKAIPVVIQYARIENAVNLPSFLDTIC